MIFAETRIQPVVGSDASPLPAFERQLKFGEGRCGKCHFVVLPSDLAERMRVGVRQEREWLKLRQITGHL
ncbi:hypothetical protein D3C71_1701750 [compost metagenome]